MNLLKEAKSRLQDAWSEENALAKDHKKELAYWKTLSEERREARQEERENAEKERRFWVAIVQTLEAMQAASNALEASF